MSAKLEKRRSTLVGFAKSEPSLKGQTKTKSKWTALSESLRRGKSDPKMASVARSVITKAKSEKGMLPIQRSVKSIATNDVRAAKHEYQAQLGKEMDTHEDEIRELCAKIAFLKRDNEKMTRNQSMKWGLSLDEMQYLVADLQKAKSVNSSLLREMESKKEETEKLQGDIDELLYRIQDVEADMDYWLQERRQFVADRERLERVEAKIKLLDIANRGLRSYLIWKKINIHSPIPPEGYNSKTIHMRSPKSDSCLTGRYSDSDNSRFPLVFNRNNLLGYVRSMDDMQIKKKRNKRTFRSVSGEHNMDPKEFIRKRQREAWMKLRPAYVFL